MKYKHKTTGEEATLLEDYYQVDGDVVPKRFIEDSCDWEKVVEKDYEILSLLDADFEISIAIYSNEFDELSWNVLCASKKFTIQSVKRLSDGEVFKVGDKVTRHSDDNCPNPNETIRTITRFCFSQGYLKFGCKEDDGYLLNFFSHAKTPIFKTVDGVDIYGGESIYAVSDDFQLFYISLARETDKTVRSFSTKENAEKYIQDNTKKYSLNDMVKIANHWAYIKSVTPEAALKVIEKW